MLKLEDIQAGTLVEGLLPGRPVTVIATIWHGDQNVEVVFQDSEKRLDRALLSRTDEERLSVAAAEDSWPLDGDGRLFKLASEARRIKAAHLFDPYVAVEAADIDPLPHQIEAVYRKMMPIQPLRFILADDPGAGKTIMSGLYIRELALRGDVERVLIVAPGSLVVQWQDELSQRFQLHFRILSNDMVETARTGNPFTEENLLIARLDQLARREDLQEKLSASRWDLVVVDEAHKMSAHYYGRKLNKTKRYQLGERLRDLTRHLLLLTATPHSGKQESYMLFLALLDEDTFGGRLRGGEVPDASHLMRRYLKESLLTFDGKPLFPERRAHSVKYDLSPPEQHLYEEVTDYVRHGMDRAKQIEQKNRRRGLVVGFALAALQRRLASSPHAIYRSLRRRRERLQKRLEELEAIAEGREVTDPMLSNLSEDDLAFFDYDDFDDEQIDEMETEVIDQATAAETVPELQKEIETLGRLVAIAAEVRKAGTDTKWEELSTVLQSEHMNGPGGTRRKIIVFTEHKDTLDYLQRRIVGLLGRRERVVVIHGSVSREHRRHRQDAFINDPEVQVMVATDAAGEGVNLQRANLMVNYDLPWNPNRIEQRFGRIHRIGQTEVCHLWNLVAHNTREGAVFIRLLDKIEEQRKALGGQVYDVLGDSVIDRQLRDLLIEAIRYGDRPDVRACRDRVINQDIGEQIRNLVDERALAIGRIGDGEIQEIRDDMERAKLRKLQPGFISMFFIEALRRFGGRIVEREKGRFEITRVPGVVRQRARETGSGQELHRRYERVTFEKHLVDVHGRSRAALLALGHPLLEAVVDTVLDRHGSVLQRGTVLVDPQATDHRLRALVQIEHLIKDGSGRDVSRRYWTVEMPTEGESEETGAARHHDLRPIEDDERALVASLLEQSGLDTMLSDHARRFAITELCGPHLDEIRRATEHRVGKVRSGVEQRLRERIRYWDTYQVRAKAKQKQESQPKGGFTAGHAQNFADELAARLEQRNLELDRELQLSSRPPDIVGGAIVVPQGLLDRLAGTQPPAPTAHARDVAEVDRRAVDAVLATERSLSRKPKEMPHNNEGYDIESRDPDTGDLYFIEVKGRIEGADTVTVSRSQIIHSQNSPDRFILAVVQVPEDRTAQPTIRYVRRPFEGVEVGYRKYSINFALSEFAFEAPS